MATITKQYYAVCNVNGPISVSIEAVTINDAEAMFFELDQRGTIDAAECDAEDDLAFCGDGMTESEFEAAMEELGFVEVRDLSDNILNGWRLFGEAIEND